MVIRLPGMSTQPQPPQHGPQPGPDPAWAHFNRTRGDGETGHGITPGRTRLHAYKPDVTAYRVLGREPAQAAREHGPMERNGHNSSVYVSYADRYLGKPSNSLSRLPVVGEIAAGQYDVTVAFQEYDCLDYEGDLFESTAVEYEHRLAEIEREAHRLQRVLHEEANKFRPELYFGEFPDAA